MKKLFAVMGFLALVTVACGSVEDGWDAGLSDGGGQDAGDSCAVLCETSAECCQGQLCIEGVCSEPKACPSGCHSECGQGWRCDRTQFLCEQTPIDFLCADDCDCYVGWTCSAGACVPICVTDEDCPTGQTCTAGICAVTDACQRREDCAGEECLVCRDGACQAPLAVCISDSDCCVGMHCNFGACVADSMPCDSDEDCTSPEQPSCVDGKCAAIGAQCQEDEDCLGTLEVCEAGFCVSTGCQATGCRAGEYCEVFSGECWPGCDSNHDCIAPATCDYANHLCRELDCCAGLCDAQGQLCDPIACQCFSPCSEGSCPEASHCNLGTGHCEPDAFDCNEDGCQAGYECNAQTGLCEPESFDCNQDGCGSGYVCDPASGQCLVDSDPCAESIACGQVVYGAWTGQCDAPDWEDSYARLYTFDVVEDQDIEVYLSSDTVDTYLILLGPDGSVQAYNDDASLWTTDSYVGGTILQGGTWTIEATTYDYFDTGSFVLELSCP